MVYCNKKTKYEKLIIEREVRRIFSLNLVISYVRTRQVLEEIIINSKVFKYLLKINLQIEKILMK